MNFKTAEGLDIENSFETIKEHLDTVSETVNDDVVQNQETESAPIWNKMKPNKTVLKKLLSLKMDINECIKIQF